MKRNERRPATAPASPAPAGPPGELTLEQARAQLAEIQAEAQAGIPTRAAAPETLSAALEPDGLTVLGVALIERALSAFPGAGASLLLAVLWALEHQRDINALAVDMPTLAKEAAALGAGIPAGQLRHLVRQAGRVVDALPGAVEFTYHVAPLVAGAPVPADLVATVQPGEAAVGEDGTRWHNSTAVALVVRKLEADPGE